MRILYPGLRRLLPRDRRRFRFLVVRANHTGSLVAAAVGDAPAVEAAFRELVLGSVAVNVVHPVSSFGTFAV